MEALSTGDLSLVDKGREREKEVNSLEVDIDERIGLLIARNQPTAVDLRLLLSISQMLPAMERCGDEAEKIAKMARRLHESAGGSGTSEHRRGGKGCVSSGRFRWSPDH